MDPETIMLSCNLYDTKLPLLFLALDSLVLAYASPDCEL